MMSLLPEDAADLPYSGKAVVILLGGQALFAFSYSASIALAATPLVFVGAALYVLSVGWALIEDSRTSGPFLPIGQFIN